MTKITPTWIKGIEISEKGITEKILDFCARIQWVAEKGKLQAKQFG